MKMGWFLELMSWQIQSSVLPENHWCAAATQNQCNGKRAPGKGDAPTSHLGQHRCHMNPGTCWVAALEKFKQLNPYRWKIPEKKIIIIIKKSLKKTSKSGVKRKASLPGVKMLRTEEPPAT